MVLTSGSVLLLCSMSAGLSLLALLLGVRREGGGADRREGPAGRLAVLARPRWAVAGVTPAPGHQGGRGAGPGGGSGRGVGGRLAVPATAAAAGWAVTGGPVGALAAGLAALWLMSARRSGATAAARRSFARGLEDALETMVSSLRAGQDVAQAIAEARDRASGPLGDALERVVSSHRAGKPLGECLEDMLREWPTSEVAYFRACLGAHLRTGGDVTALLINLGGVMRERRNLAGDLASRTGEARATAALLALLPPALLTYILLTEPSQLRPLLSSPAGLGLGALAAVSWVIGVAVVRGLLDGLAREIEEG